MFEIIHAQVKYRIVVSTSFTLQAVLDSLRIKNTSDVCYSHVKQEHMQTHNLIGSLDLEPYDVVEVK